MDRLSQQTLLGGAAIETPPTAGLTWGYSTFKIRPQALGWSGSEYLMRVGAQSIYASSDGTNWRLRGQFGENQATGGIHIIFFNGAWRHATGSGPIWSSTDNGVTWVKSFNSTSPSWNAMAHSSTTAVAVGSGGTIRSSTNGTTWSSRTSGTTVTLNGVVWTGSQFVAVGSSGTIRTSPDGIAWTARTSGVTVGLTAVATSGSVIVAVGTSGTIITSTDGITWTARTSVVTTAFRYVAWRASAGEFIASYASSSQLLRSTNGTTWTTFTPPNFERLMTIGSTFSPAVYGFPNHFIVATHPSETSTSGGSTLWRGTTSSNIVFAHRLPHPQARIFGTSPDRARFNSIQHINGLYFAVHDNGVYSSPDGLTWTHRFNLLSSTTDGAFCLAFGNGVYVVGGFANSSFNGPSKLWSSTNLSTWTDRTSVLPASLADLGVHKAAFGAGRFIIAGRSTSGGVLATSTSGTSGYTVVNTGFTATVNHIIWTGDRFIACGTSGLLAVSNDGLTWTSLNSGTSAGLLSVAWTGDSIVVGLGGSIRRTTNEGATWTVFNPSGIGDVCTLSYSSRVLIAGTSSGRIYRSEDRGETWTLVPDISHAFQSITGASGTFVSFSDFGTVIVSPTPPSDFPVS
jgi:hypothetical protein